MCHSMHSGPFVHQGPGLLVRWTFMIASVQHTTDTPGMTTETIPYTTKYNLSSSTSPNRIEQGWNHPVTPNFPQTSKTKLVSFWTFGFCSCTIWAYLAGFSATWSRSSRLWPVEWMRKSPPRNLYWCGHQQHPNYFRFNDHLGFGIVSLHSF